MLNAARHPRASAAGWASITPLICSVADETSVVGLIEGACDLAHELLPPSPVVAVSPLQHVRPDRIRGALRLGVVRPNADVRVNLARPDRAGLFEGFVSTRFPVKSILGHLFIIARSAARCSRRSASSARHSFSVYGWRLDRQARVASAAPHGGIAECGMIGAEIGAGFRCTPSARPVRLPRGTRRASGALARRPSRIVAGRRRKADRSAN